MLSECRRAAVVSVVALAVGVLGMGAQQLPTASPESVGLSAERLQRIETAVAQSIKDQQIAGAVTLVVRHGKVAYLKPQGMLDREAGKPMPADAMFRICSMTKPITSVAVMMLYEEGKFALEDPISKYLPEFKNPKVLVKPANGGAPYTIPATREITIRDLLRHTSGLTYNWNETLGKMYDDANVATGIMQFDGTIEDSVKHLAAQPLLFNPGERWEYSLGVDVLGRLVEVVSGMPLDQFFKTRIFEPLGMKDSYFYPPQEKVSRLARAYGIFDDKLTRFPDKPVVDGYLTYSADYPVNGPKKLFSGGGGLVSTAEDYARFCQMMLDNGKANGKQLLSSKSVELMTHDQLGKIGPEQGFGLGFGIDGMKAPLDELGTPGEYGWGGFFYTQFRIDPKEQMIVIFMAQLHPAGDVNIQNKVMTLAYQAINE
ncbi:MAG TPA: serine hydrolase domain-containing protein [Terracidiphilus sp.]|jgi:CubicO group peptidase (beta-lactamase class C family)